MQVSASSAQDYIAQLPAERQAVMQKLRETITDNLPPDFSETIAYGMIGYVVPHSVYPAGYHCKPAEPLPFMSIAAQKNFYALYHMGIYANPELMDWFLAEYPKHTSAKLDMGKSCIRFKKPEHIPHALIAQLVQKMSAQQWINLYENAFRKGKNGQ
ncbi:DUF1801 domain-containing protein [Cytophagales bacterium LB-30]|uniref:DUF1801 domain-containing protein n=1 Tax=Shiella aurantiaca TaxID=3058365 RepID=A0ABT8F4Z2_9BACT|nr:DUF1801 domain-containing protein [Shiella aurantiaca]MDN4165051.1 DUF1801 domain-containing protein [Shiella aurantiaca]